MDMNAPPNVTNFSQLGSRKTKCLSSQINPYEPCELYESFAPSVKKEAAKDFRQFGCA